MQRGFGENNMVCHVCGTFTNPQYFFCYDCYKKKNLGEIIKCHDCKTWQPRSKYDHLRCPSCYQEYELKHNRALPEASNERYLVKENEYDHQIKSDLVTKRLIEIHNKRKTMKKPISIQEHRLNNLYRSVHTRDRKKQCENRGWADGGYY